MYTYKNMEIKYHNNFNWNLYIIFNHFLMLSLQDI